MTDFTSRDTTYYSGFQYNNTADGQDCSINNQLIAPIVTKANEYQVALSKMEIPLGGIPIGGESTNLIPLKSWEITIQNGNISGSAFVRQVNSITGNFLYNATPDNTAQLQKFTYTQAGVTTLVSSVVLQPYIIQMVVDDYGNAYTTQASAQGGIPTNLVVYDTSGAVLLTLNYPSISCMTIDNNQNILIATDSRVFVYTNVNSFGSVALTLAATITENNSAQPLSQIITVASDGYIMVGYNKNNIALYNTAYQPIADSTETTITQLGRASQILTSENRFILTDTGVVDEVYFGVPESSNTLQEMVSATAYNTTCDFNAFANLAIVGNTCVGIEQTTLNTISFTPNVLPGSVTAPKTTLVSGDNLSNCVAYPNTNGFMSNGTGASARINYGWNLDNVSQAYFEFDTLFQDVTTNPVQNFAIQPGSNRAFLTNSASPYGMCSSSAGYFPKQMIISQPVQSTPKSIYNIQFGFGWNNTGTNLQTLVQMNQYPFNSSNNLYNCDYFIDNAVGAFNLVWDQTANVVNVNQFNIGNLQLVTNQQILQNSSGQTIRPTSFARMVPVGNNYLAVVGDWQGADAYKLFIYEYGSPTPVYGEVWGSTTGQVFLASIPGNNYLAISNGSDASVWVLNFSTPAVPTLQSVNPIADITNIWGLTMVSLGNIVVLVHTGSLYELHLLTYNADFTNPGEILSPVGGYGSYSANQLILNENQVNLLSSNLLIQEFCVLLNSQQIEVFKSNTSVPSLWYELTSIMSVPMSNTVTFCCYAPLITGMTDFNAVSLSGGITQVQNFTISPLHPDSIYIINKADKLVYRGVYNAGTESVTGLTRYAPITGTFTTINIIQSPSVLISRALSFRITDQSSIGSPYVVGNEKIISIARNAVTEEFILSVQATSNNIISLNTKDNTLNYQNTIQNIGPIWSKNSEDLDAGPVPVYTYEPIIANVNIAFAEAWNRFINSGGQVILPPPYISYNYQTGYLTLTYQQTLSGSAGPPVIAPTAFILFSQSLLQYFYFYNIPNGDNYQIVLPPSTSSYTQTVRSLFRLNSLAQLILVSDTIFVDSSFQGNNILNRNIASIDIPTDTFFAGNYDQNLQYAPSFLRTFRLASNQSISNLTFRLNYQTKDGNQYVVQLIPNESWTFIVMLIKKT